ncbi:unnamed protein product, partial [Effrenium voratum]
AVVPAAQPAVCRGCEARIGRHVVAVFFRSGRTASSSVAHLACLALVPGLQGPGSRGEVAFSPFLDTAARSDAWAALEMLPAYAPARGRQAPGSDGSLQQQLQRRLLAGRDFTSEDYELLLQLDGPSGSARTAEQTE